MSSMETTADHHHGHHGHTRETAPAEEEALESAPRDTHEHEGHHAHMVADFRRRFWICAALTVPILALSPMIQAWVGLEGRLAFPGDELVLLALSAFVYLWGGWPFLRGSVDELRSKRPGMMTLVAMAITVAFVYSAAVVAGLEGEVFFWETTTLIDLMLLGHWIEMRSVMGASRALEELARLLPAAAHLVREDGVEEDVPVARLAPGDRVRVKSGEKIPADGRVVDGRSTVNEAMLTGESVPVDKGAGDAVIAGAINERGALLVEVERTGAESYLSQVIELVREAQQSKSRTQDLASRAAFALTLIAISVGAVTLVGWLLAGEGTQFSIARAVTVMVIACPHALGLAVPLVVAVSTSISANRGLLIRNRAAFERARELDTMVFDKTGTLTEGRFGVTEIVRFAEESEDELLALAAAIEAGSEHPIAAGVVGSARQRGLASPEARGFESITGEGVRATIEGRALRVVSPGAVRGLSFPTQRVDALGREGKTVVYLATEPRVLGALALADVVRPSAAEAIRTLHAMGVEVVMLTGDKREVAEHVAAQIGIGRVIAEVRPEDKSARIAALQAEGRVVAMTGDGVNDAPALARADVGIAIGAGTDVAVESADIVLVRSDPVDAVQVIQLAKATYRKMVQNLWYAAGYNVIAIPLAAGVLAGIGMILSPAVGAVLMSLSTVVVAINARLLKVPPHG